MTDWTDTPPTEAGDYQWRASCTEEWSDVHRVDSRGLWSMRTGGLVREPRGQWWPVPIQRPGEGTDWPRVVYEIGCEWKASATGTLIGEQAKSVATTIDRRIDAAVARHTKGGT